MSQAYSIDLGIHPDATGGRSGEDEKIENAFPMQISLIQGTLVPKSGRVTGFTPDGLASFHQIRVGDVIIFRIFDTRSIGPTVGRSLQGVGLLKATFTDLQGNETSRPWQGDENFPIAEFGAHQLSRAFTSKLEGMVLPCYHQCYQKDRPDEIVTYTVLPTTRKYIPYLFSVVVEAKLGMAPETIERFYYRDDPEMVISSDDRPGDGEEDRA
jgi:hypothetical protein